MLGKKTKLGDVCPLWDRTKIKKKEEKQKKSEVEDEVIARLIFSYLNCRRVLLWMIDFEVEIELWSIGLSDVDEELRMSEIRVKGVVFIKVGWALYLVYGSLCFWATYKDGLFFW